MKAAVLLAYGDVDQLQIRDMPDPAAHPNALLVRVAAASINPVDWKMRSGAAKDRFPVQFPGILGRDASGEVVAIGDGVTAFKVGDKVLGLVNGAYAELVTSPVETWVAVPAELDVVDAGALPLALVTGAQLMERAVDPFEGATVLVTGAVGSVGRVAVHAAKLRGARVWAGVRGSRREEASRLAVDGVVALDDPASIAKAPIFDAIADTVGGDTIQKLYEKLKPKGKIGSVLGEPPGAKERGFTVNAFMAQPDSKMLARYALEVAKGKLVIPIAAKFPLAQVREAQTLAEKKHPPGKVLLLP
ncbi:MAG TPA: NADP-dependent oxidoreductase [Polyangiaceae bacterium]|jgi:NADPH:quinone reductase-like Zn-dependent oxidoreductase|nr:NADP-dependent oxidoreductase [Polyangiaceae bacterium]